MKRNLAGLLALCLIISIWPGFTTGAAAVEPDNPKPLYGAEAERVFADARTASGDFVDFALTGAQGSVSIQAALPEYAKAKSALLRLGCVCIAPSASGDAALTLSMDGETFCVIPMNHAEGGTVVAVDIPVKRLHRQGGVIQIRASHKTADGGNAECLLRFDDSSCLRVSYDVAEDWRALAHYPYPYVSLRDPTGANAAVAVSRAMDEGELAAALMIMADLGGETTGANDITLCRLNDEAERDVIYIGLERNTPKDILDLCADVTLDDAMALVRRANHNGRNMLVVLARTAEALAEGARLLCDRARVMQLESDTCIVRVGEADAFYEASAKSALIIQDEFTFQSFLGGGVMFQGAYRQKADVTLPVANGYTLAGNAKFVLRVRYSENLSFDRAMVTVYWGEIPMYSHKLSRQGAAGETLVFTTPSDLVGAAGSKITIAFDLDVDASSRAAGGESVPWAYVAADSSVYLPMGESGALDLGNLPAPFLRGGALSDILVVTSDNPGALELKLLGQVMGMMGSGGEGHGSLRVARAGTFAAQDAKRHIITVGRPDQNEFIRSMQDQLHFKFTEDLSRFSSNEQLALTETYAAQIGTVQLMPSPFDRDRALLCVTASGDEGLGLLRRLCGTERLRQSLGGDATVVDHRDRVFTYRFQAQSPSANRKPTVVETIMANGDSLRFTLIATSAMLLLLICVVLVLLRIRARAKKEKRT